MSRANYDKREIYSTKRCIFYISNETKYTDNDTQEGDTSPAFFFLIEFFPSSILYASGPTLGQY